MILRAYQSEAIQAVYNSWKSELSGHYLVVIPTGGGKSFIIADLIRQLYEQYKTRILILTHIKELIQQNFDELVSIWPLAPAGIYSAGIGRKDMQSPILFAGIQSISKKVHDFDNFDIVIVDEADLVPRSENTQYKKTLDLIKLNNPNVRFLGFTATPYRLDSGWLHKGEGKIFDHIVYEAYIQNLINDGYLCNIRAKPGEQEGRIDTSKVGHRGGEFIESELIQAAMQGDVTEKAVKDFVERGKNRKKWLIFACGVEHAEKIQAELNKLDINSKVITGNTPKKERDDIIDSFKKGQSLSIFEQPIKALINVNILTVGFNCPDIDMLVLMRPTESSRLYVQMIGRGMRTAPGKTDCLVLDYAGNVLRHGPVDCINPEKPMGKGSGIAPVKECPECGCYVHAAARKCEFCGYEFPKIEVKIEEKPIEAPILAEQVEPEEHEVDTMEISVHKKEGKQACIKVVYNCGLEMFFDWFFPEASWPRQQWDYYNFCKALQLKKPYPNTANEFVQNGVFYHPVKIWTKPEGKYTRVVKREWPKLEEDIPF